MPPPAKYLRLDAGSSRAAAIDDDHVPDSIALDVPLPSSPTRAPRAPLPPPAVIVPSDSIPTSTSGFSVTVAALTQLIDPKDPAHLASLGGPAGVCRALRVDPKRGLCPPLTDYEPPSVVHARALHDAKAKSWSAKVRRVPAYAPPLGAGGRRVSGAVGGGREEVGPPPTREEEETARRDMQERVTVFGANRLPEVKMDSIFELMWAALQDRTLIMLTIAAIVSLALGLYEDFGMHHDDVHHEKVKWVEGVAIIVAVLIVVLVASVNDWQKERQFRALSAKVDDRTVKVLRRGAVTRISVYDVLVGDVLMLEPGDILPVDGVYLHGHGLRCDESAATGESDAIRKAQTRGPDHDMFLLSGSKVIEGTGLCIVTAVGINTLHGRTMMSMRTEDTETPLQVKLNELAEQIAKLGMAAASLILVVLLIKYLAITGAQGGFVDGPNKQSPAKILESITQIFITTITVLVVAVPEGLPLAVTLSLAFATKKMLADNNLVRVLAACEVMGNATTICSDKTGTLTQNRMTVVKGRFGAPEPNVRAQATVSDSSPSLTTRPSPSSDLTSADDVPRLRALIDDPRLWLLLQDAIAINSTAFEDVDLKSGTKVLIGSKTETALLEMQQAAGGPAFSTARAGAEIVHIYPFSSASKWMGTVQALGPNAACSHRLHVKGAAEIVLAHCSATYVRGVGPVDMTPAHIAEWTATIQKYAAESLRAIALAYMDVAPGTLPDDLATHAPLGTAAAGAGDGTRTPQPATPARSANDLSPQKSLAVQSHSQLAMSDLLPRLETPLGSTTALNSSNPADGTAVGPAITDAWCRPVPAEHRDRVPSSAGRLVLLAVVGIEDPLRPGVTEAVDACQRAGVFVRMVTGDNLTTARAIAAKCGIYSKGGIVMEGRAFRKLPREQMDKVLPRLQVLARSSPLDKQVLVDRLKALGETVAVTGDGTNDGPALKMADVGFSMGISGTEVAKEASSIILLDDNFSSIVKAMLWGRSVNDSVKKFLQFQLTVNITAVILTFITAVVSNEEKSILTAVQLLWVNLIMDSLAALALATEPPQRKLLDRHPDPKSAPLITYSMWKMVAGQAIFQIVVNLLALYVGPLVVHDETVLRTVVFNTFIFLQIFNEINCRHLTNDLNVFRGIGNNKYFVAILLLTITLQVIIVELGGSAFHTVPLSVPQWLFCIGIGFLSIPMGALIRVLPDWFYVEAPTDRVFLTKERLRWLHTVSQIQTQLKVFKALRGAQRVDMASNVLTMPAGNSRHSIFASATGLPTPTQQQPASPPGTRHAAHLAPDAVKVAVIGGGGPAKGVRGDADGRGQELHAADLGASGGVGKNGYFSLE
ncbi:calcium-translocating P-type ATPase, PMCA-type [Allomyces macrogynus ATCC 38327]|uniref:Calcium-transporting ATPase n=1 Tax=Allomyces macrogynus (strain ATCC 38327) TaxID=578462 RepID=A0A0L0SL37_ALLM3|nr:calcium-translocating P-type ATPase, PMCA-type [Allomyces macrogynus ATCC 38327]|eukprot:KNE63148.1 calcium-translocating P-type ATPase, PMCA-type [Allomyces macrogynus ATCC 38327]